MICDAVDILMQIGIRHEIRRVTAISVVVKELEKEDVAFGSIFRFRENSLGSQPVWDKNDEKVESNRIKE